MSKSLMLLFCVILVASPDSILVSQNFAPAVNYTVPLRPYTIASADFNNDGFPDLATPSSVAFNSDGIGWITILKNNGKGIFKVSDSIAVGDASCLEAADLDKDGDIDIIASDIYTKRIYILLNDGTGAFAVSDSFASGGNTATNSFELGAADLDGDGDYDLVVPVWPNTISVFFNDGHGKFSAPVSYTAGNHPYKVSSADLDHDGDSDIVVTNNGGGSVSVFLNKGDGTFGPRVDYSVGIYPQGVSLADYNGDGNLDMAVANASPNTPKVSVFIGKGDGTFGPRVDYPGCRPHSIASADYDGDGDIDMAVANNECNSVSIFLNNGDGTFAPHFMLQTGNGTNHVVARDFDGDGDLDLALENFDHDGTPGNTVSVLLNQLFTSVAKAVISPTTCVLEQNYPNPFNPSTEIRFTLLHRSTITLKVFDLLGREMATPLSGVLSAGAHSARWDAAGFPSGVYFYQLRADEFKETKKLMLVR